MSKNVRFSLGIVTENQKQVQKAEKLAAFLVDLLPNISNFDIKTYNKFPNSYRIEFEGSFQSEDHIHESIQIADSICSPWTVMYDRDQQTIELIFNTSEHCTFENQDLQFIRWAHFQILF